MTPAALQPTLPQVRGARNSPLPAWSLLASAFALVACDPRPGENTADATTPAQSAPDQPTAVTAATTAPVPPTTPPSADPEVAEPWRYGPALAAAIPAGVHAEPVLELADGIRGRARIVVAVASGDRPVRLEVWDFSQNNERGLLTRIGDPQILLDLGDVRGRLVTDAVATLRREIASPGTEVVRPRGLPGGPEQVLAELARLATASTAGPDAATRARSLALFIRGIDSQLLWDKGRLPELLRRLQNAPWIIESQSQLGGRRTIHVREEGRPVELLLALFHGRWLLFSVDDGPQPSSAAAAPAAEPSPTAP